MDDNAKTVQQLGLEAIALLRDAEAKVRQMARLYEDKDYRYWAREIVEALDGSVAQINVLPATADADYWDDFDYRSTAKPPPRIGGGEIVKGDVPS